MHKILTELLEAAESNLERYRAAGDDRAISAGLIMVEGLRRDLAAVAAVAGGAN